MSFHKELTGPGHSLFLDRDGVINRRLPGDYIRTWDQFEFLPGTLEALKILAVLFGKIFVVSNQQGIGKGLMTEEQLADIHNRMLSEVTGAGGRIDRIYYSPYLESEGSVHRKPNIGMGIRARKDFPGIDLRKSVMVGDSLSDMVFGHRLKMVTVFLSVDKAQVRKGQGLIDYVFPDLLAFAKWVGTLR